MTGMEFASVSKNVKSTEEHEEGDLLSQRSVINESTLFLGITLHPAP